MEEHLTKLESGTPVAVGEEAEVANLDEAWWQDMEQEPPHELDGIERH
jgi:hypothetical protein